MPKKGSKRFTQLTRTGSDALRVRGRDSASKPAFVMPEELEQAKALVRAGNAGTDQGVINRANQIVDGQYRINLAEQSMNVTMDDVDVLSVSTDQITQQARTMAPTEAGAVIATMSNLLDAEADRTEDDDHAERIRALQGQLVQSFSGIEPSDSPLTPNLGKSKRDRAEFAERISNTGTRINQRLDFGEVAPSPIEALPSPPPSPSPTASPAAAPGFFARLPAFSLPGWAAEQHDAENDLAIDVQSATTIVDEIIDSKLIGDEVVGERSERDQEIIKQAVDDILERSAAARSCDKRQISLRTQPLMQLVHPTCLPVFHNENESESRKRCPWLRGPAGV